jgi:hypothetical protein
MPVTDIDDRALHNLEDDDSVAGRLVPREAFNLRMTKMKMLQQSSKILQIEKKRMRKHAMQKLKRID